MVGGVVSGVSGVWWWVWCVSEWCVSGGGGEWCVSE